MYFRYPAGSAFYCMEVDEDYYVDAAFRGAPSDFGIGRFVNTAGRGFLKL